MPHNIQLGKMGEDMAAQYLIDKGHKILHRNYTYERGEIDIISQIGDTIVFTEVKTRRNNKYGYPEDAVTDTKKQKILQVATYYMQINRIKTDPRIDIIAITMEGIKPEIVHHEDAFYHF